MDVVPPHTRSRMMAGIRGKNTKPERILRQALFSLGLRYRINVRALPGTPDIVFPRWRAVIQVHGCFWHGHDCHLFKWPKQNAAFWHLKIKRNRDVDQRAERRLIEGGWRVLVVWECALRGFSPEAIGELARTVKAWIKSREQTLVLRGS